VPDSLYAPLISASAPKCKAASAFPADYKKLDKNGFVLLVLNINKAGNIEHGEVEKTSGFPELDEAALKQVTETWSFEPCKKAGTAVACRQTIKFKWKIENNKK
jgi:TonB family protein